MIAGGLGSFEPRKPLISNIGDFEGKGVRYIVKDPDQFEKKDMVISGGGDSALDWAIYFAEKGSFVHLVHRSDRYRAHKDSVSRAQELAAAGKMKLHTFAEVKELNGDDDLTAVVIHTKEANTTVDTELWFPLFGLSPKLGPIGDWGLDIEKNAIVVDTFDYQTNRPGVFAIGDVNTYPGKLKLILCGFHEATLAVQTAYKIINPDKKFTLKYTTVQGVQGFEDEQPKQTITS
jgi:thioredoxin reductase (NADPH)